MFAAMFQDVLPWPMRSKKATRLFLLLFSWIVYKPNSWLALLGRSEHCLNQPSKVCDTYSYCPAVNFLRECYFSLLVHVIKMYWKPAMCHNQSFCQKPMIKAVVTNKLWMTFLDDVSRLGKFSDPWKTSALCLLFAFMFRKTLEFWPKQKMSL